MYILLPFETCLMLRALVLCLTIVAAFHTPLAAAPLVTQATVSAPVSELAERLGMNVARDRGRFVPEIIRRIYSPPPTRQITLTLLPLPGRTPGAAPVAAAARPAPGTQTQVDMPLTLAFWSEHIFKRQIPPDQWLAWVLSERRAALVCRGLLGADDETLAFYEAHPGLVAFIYEHAPGAFAAIADSIHVHDGRVRVAGGQVAEGLWQGLLHVPASEPDAFIRALLFEPEARLAYLFDALEIAAPASRAFALGTWIDDEALRTQRFQALGAAVRSSFREWHIEEMPFTRPLNDLAMLLLRIGVTERGEPTAPASRRFWSAALDASVTLDVPGVVLPASASAHTLVDAAWLVQATSGDMYTRGDKLDQFAFGQRVFARVTDADADLAASVIHEMTPRRMLLLGLDRIGVRDPKTYAAGLKQARDVLDSGADRFWTTSQQQGVLALIVRMVVTGTLTQSDAATLTQSLFALPVASGDFHGALADWFQRVFAAKLPRGVNWQARAVAAAAGGPTPGAPILEWEGQRYSIDLAAGEQHRIIAVQEHQGGPDLDLAFTLNQLGRRALQASSIDNVRPLIAEAQAVLASSGAALARPAVNVLPPGVAARRDGREWLSKAIDDLERAVRTNDLRRANRAGDSLVELGDVATGHSLLSLMYAVHLGDPDGPALLGANVALRHDFGFGRNERQGRSRGPWAQPRQDFQPGIPWHVAGSLVGLDVALAPLALHRLSMDSLAVPPQLQSIEREAFAGNVALLNARSLRDIDRDRIADAIAKGRRRVQALKPNSPEFEKLKDEILLDGWRARTLAWVLQSEPNSVENQFSLAELLVLGEPDATIDAWGANGQLTYGCVCTRFPGPRIWRVVAGRPQLPMLAASTVEMNLELAQRFAAGRLPAALLPSVLGTAMQDFVDRVDTADPGDRAALLAYPRTITRSALEDAVAATATFDGPLIPDGGTQSDR
ncbi:MAG: hypothetical protein U0Q11_00995 [Vicinamibacterales bacterium]